MENEVKQDAEFVQYQVIRLAVEREIMLKLESRSWLFSPSFVKRAAAVTGYVFLASVVLRVIVFALLVLLGVLAGGGTAGVAL